MSRFAGVVRLDGAPADAGILRPLSAALRLPGGEDVATRVEGSAALAHSLLLPSPASPGDRGPATLDGSAWIVASARVDARAGLLRDLRAAGRPVDPAADDAALLLHAWHAWRDALPERVLGDFALAVWDAARGRLLLARDPFGVRPLYHARAGDSLVFSNTLAAVLAHPGVEPALDEGAVAEHLLFGQRQDPAGTAFAGVRALPPGHRLVADAGGVRVERWWTVPRPEPLVLSGPRAYAAAFREVFGAAVADRLAPEGETAILLSGGRDSVAVAQAAVGAGGSLRGVTMVYDRIMPHEERRYAGMAAEVLRFPVCFVPADGVRMFEGWGTPALDRPEPVDNPLLATDVELRARAAAASGVVLTGIGADGALRESRARLAALLAGGRPLRAAREAAEYVRVHRRLPRPGFRTLRRRRAGLFSTTPYPAWLEPEFERRLDLRARWEEGNRPLDVDHPLRPEAAGQLSSPLWARTLEGFDPGVTGIPLEGRHPFLDVRVVRFLLSVPPAQWYNDKGLLRLLLAVDLPPEFLRRQKAPLAEDPYLACHAADPAGWLGGRAPSAAVDAWVRRAALPRWAGGGADAPVAEPWLHLRPLTLSLWLERRATRR